MLKLLAIFCFYFNYTAEQIFKKSKQLKEYFNLIANIIFVSVNLKSLLTSITLSLNKTSTSYSTASAKMLYVAVNDVWLTSEISGLFGIKKSVKIKISLLKVLENLIFINDKSNPYFLNTTFLLRLIILIRAAQ